MPNGEHTGRENAETRNWQLNIVWKSAFNWGIAEKILYPRWHGRFTEKELQHGETNGVL